MKRKRVLIISHIFPPVGGSGVQRTLKFVKYLREFGWEPVVLTVGKTGYPLQDYSLLKEIPKDIKVIRVDEPSELSLSNLKENLTLLDGIVDDKIKLKKYFNLIKENKNQIRDLILPDYYLFWANNVLEHISTVLDSGSVEMIYSTSGPFSDHIIGYYLKMRWCKPWIMDLRDEWSNNPYNISDKKDNIFYQITVLIEERLLRTADKVLTTTPVTRQNYIDFFRLPEEKVHIITNGYDEEDFNSLNSNLTHNERFTVVHNGLFYLIRTPVTFLQAVHRLISKGLLEKEKIKLVFSWSENDKSWIEVAHKLELKDILETVGYLEHKESLEMANRADALLLIVGPGRKNKAVYPAKLFEYLRLRKPIIALSPNGGVVDNLIRDLECGINCDFDDTEAIEKYLYELYLQWSSSNIRVSTPLEEIKVYERKCLTKKLANVLDILAKEYQEENLSKTFLRFKIEELVEVNNISEAKKLINEYTRKYGFDAEIFSILGIISLSVKKIQEAENYFLMGINEDKNNPHINFNLGYLYELKGNVEKSLQHYQNVLKFSEDVEMNSEVESAIRLLTEIIKP
ncbi:glycosyltransferase [Priestia sp. TRN 1309]|uniref:glycosyltransferase n=1 Tax=Priestia sp. TRN 1309 TaxID=3420729 RepID=UPI003D7801E6